MDAKNGECVMAASASGPYPNRRCGCFSRRPLSSATASMEKYEGKRGRFPRMFSRSFVEEMPSSENGVYPAINSNNSTPMLHQSAALLCPLACLLSIISGAMYSTVPTYE
jgi:hypothetical protein